MNPIVEKSMNFAVDIVNLVRFLESENEYVLSKQILRSGTSIGANVAEAERAYSKAEFRAKMGISLKEAAETKYWLDLLYKTNYIDEPMYTNSVIKCEELIKILVAITKSS